MDYCLLVTSQKPYDLLNNCLLSMVACGINSEAISIYSDEFKFYKEKFPEYNHIDLDSMPISQFLKNNSNYFGYGEGNFNIFTSIKFLALLDLCSKTTSDIVFIDCDIAFKVNPTDYFGKILQSYKYFFQLESYSLFPPTACTGIIGVKNDKESIDMLKAAFLNLLNANANGQSMCDQDIINYFLASSSNFLKSSFFLPQVNFPVGKISHAYEQTKIHNINKDLKAPPPVCFHANHVAGIENKIQLLKATGFYHS